MDLSVNVHDGPLDEVVEQACEFEANEQSSGHVGAANVHAKVNWRNTITSTLSYELADACQAEEIFTRERSILSARSHGSLATR